MDIKNLYIEDIVPYEKNPRKNDEAVKYVAESIKEFGFKVPIVLDKNNVIVAGHTRYKAAKKLGMETVPCIIADDLSEEQIKAFRLADNKVAEKAEWDEELLWQELQELEEMDMSMDVFGFEEFDIEDDDIEAEEDFYEPELPDQPKAQLGDIYKLGNHRLMCGSSTDQDDVDALTEGAEMDLCVTDPPYNVDIGGKMEMMNEYNNSNNGRDGHILNDKMDKTGFYEFLYEFYTQMLRSLKPGGAFYIWHAETEGASFRVALEDAGGQIRQCLIWNKNTFVLSRQDYHWKHEPCLYGWKDGAGHYFIDDRSQTTVWEDKVDVDKLSKEEMKELLKSIFEDKVPTTVMNEAKPTVNDLHPTMKPIKLIARLVKNSSRKGENVIDFFGGSGSTIIACEQLGRNCYTMELDPKYVDVIIDRWETLTGEKAVKIKGEKK